LGARKLFLHIGPPKTGTSAVQHVLRAYEGDDLNYPTIGQWADGSHHNLVFNYYADFGRPETIRGDIGHWLRQIGDQAKTNQEGDLLISSESLAHRDLRPFTQDILNALPDEDWEVEVLVVVRSHLERAASLYNQTVKDAHSLQRATPDEFLCQRVKGLCYAPLMSRLKPSDWKVSVINYHPSDTFVDRFLAHVGVRQPGVQTNERRNMSLSKKVLIATLAANRVAQSAKERKRYFAELVRLRPAFAPSCSIFNPAEARRAEMHFRADREFLSTQFGVGLPAPDFSVMRSEFFLRPNEWREIASAVEALGEEGRNIAHIAEAFVRPAQNPANPNSNRQAAVPPVADR
jgi:hypothetical protein